MVKGGKCPCGWEEASLLSSHSEEGIIKWHSTAVETTLFFIHSGERENLLLQQGRLQPLLWSTGGGGAGCDLLASAALPCSPRRPVGHRQVLLLPAALLVAFLLSRFAA